MNPASPLYFDYLSAARDADLDPAQIDRLVARWRQDYGNDRMLLELRLLRVCRAIEKGACSYDEAVAPEPERFPRFAA